MTEKIQNKKNNFFYKNSIKTLFGQIYYYDDNISQTNCKLKIITVKELNAYKSFE